MQHYDLVIVGAGIHGVAVAREACQRGLRVALIERRAAAGLETSSASSKLIHGGLRYLETGQFRLVFECLRERRWLIQHYPDLVQMKTFVLPVYHSSQRHPLTIAAGLFLYWLLSAGQPPFGAIPVKQKPWLKLGLRKEGLRAIFRYPDAQTDDRQLTQRICEEAEQLGCHVMFDAEITKINQSVGQGTEQNNTNAFVIQLKRGEALSCRSLVNAAGPWVNQVAAMIDPAPPVANLLWLQGSHIVLNIPSPEACIYCEAAADGRAVFILPWQGKTMVGTTELPLQKPEAKVTDEEVEYLLAVYNYYFPQQGCNKEQISSTYCGVRALIDEQDKSSSNSSRSRDTTYITFPSTLPNYVGIYGGKLTSHRVTAKKAVDQLMPNLKSIGDNSRRE